MSGLVRAEVRSCFVGVNAYNGHYRGYSTSCQDRRLNIILENILDRNKPVVWHSHGLTMLKANLGDGVTAVLYLGAEEHETTIKVSDYAGAVYREIPYDWLVNWTVAKETSPASEQISEEFRNRITTKD